MLSITTQSKAQTSLKQKHKVYVLNTGDISYHSVEDNLFNHGLFQFLGESREVFPRKSNPSFFILSWQDSESMKRNHSEKALIFGGYSG